jgi:hypothetical protein
MGSIDWCHGRAVVDKSEPTGVAVRQDIYGCSAFFLIDMSNQLQPVFADFSAGLRIVICNFLGCREGNFLFLLNALGTSNCTQLSVNRPSQFTAVGLVALNRVAAAARLSSSAIGDSAPSVAR